MAQATSDQVRIALWECTMRFVLLSSGLFVAGSLTVSGMLLEFVFMVADTVLCHMARAFEAPESNSSSVDFPDQEHTRDRAGS